MNLLIELASEIIKEQREELLTEYPSVDLDLTLLEDPDSWKQHVCRAITPDEQLLWPEAEAVFELRADSKKDLVQVEIFTQGLAIYGSRVTVNGL